MKWQRGWSQGPRPGFRQAVNGARKPHQGRAVDNEVDADGQADEKCAGSGPSGQKVDAQRYRDEARKHRPSPPGELNHTGPDSTE